jgi:DNA segregation ATPase FtsK/SpoIIIE-like protein
MAADGEASDPRRFIRVIGGQVGFARPTTGPTTDDGRKQTDGPADTSAYPGSGDDELGDDEELYEQALDVLKASRRASTSMLQRRLRIGYNRAARIMEIMEEKGIVGPENGSSPREILVDLNKE